MIQVKVVRQENSSALVEWTEDGLLKRSILPSTEIDEEGNVENPNIGLAYGFPFADYITVDVTPEDIEKQLHIAGVWTTEDLLTKPSLVQGAVIAAYGAVLGNLLANVSNFVQNGEV